MDKQDLIEKVSIDKEYLMNFEKEIVDLYEAGKIHSPIHLSGGNEDQLIEIFKNVKDEDWVFSTWRSHYHALLKSKNPEWLKNEILEDRSIHANSNQYKIFSSAIVGGILPIAVGTAMGIRQKNSGEHVWCFVGDMASKMGAFSECTQYAGGQDLPITFVVEDNGIGVYTPTNEVWKNGRADIIKYEYERRYPHYGIGKWVDF